MEGQWRDQGDITEGIRCASGLYGGQYRRVRHELQLSNQLIYSGLGRPFLRAWGKDSANPLLGERTRPRVLFSAPSRKTAGARAAHHLVSAARPPPTGEGAGRHTRGRVRSPRSRLAESLRGLNGFETN